MTEKDTKWVRLHLILSSCCPNRRLVSVQSAALFCHSAIFSRSVDVDPLFTVSNLSFQGLFCSSTCFLFDSSFMVSCLDWPFLVSGLWPFWVSCFWTIFQGFMSLFKVLHGLMSSIRVSQFHVFEPPVPSSCLWFIFTSSFWSTFNSLLYLIEFVLSLINFLGICFNFYQVLSRPPAVFFCLWFTRSHFKRLLIFFSVVFLVDQHYLPNSLHYHKLLTWTSLLKFTIPQLQTFSMLNPSRASWADFYIFLCLLTCLLICFRLTSSVVCSFESVFIKYLQSPLSLLYSGEMCYIH